MTLQKESGEGTETGDEAASLNASGGVAGLLGRVAVGGGRRARGGAGRRPRGGAVAGDRVRRGRTSRSRGVGWGSRATDRGCEGLAFAFDAET